jgi:hypothetical protein
MIKHQADAPYDHKTAIEILKNIFMSCGYVRQHPRRGWEVRYIPKDDDELQRIRSAIRSLGITVSDTFIKHRKPVQPLYGKDIVSHFLPLHEAKKAARAERQAANKAAREALAVARATRKAARLAKKAAQQKQKVAKKAARQKEKAAKKSAKG